MKKNKKGVEMKDYPKLIKVGDKKIRVLNKAEEDKALDNQPKQTDPAKSTGWGK